MSIELSSKSSTAIKICGITTPPQAKSIAQLGVNAIGVIGVKNSPRFVSEQKRSKIFDEVKLVSSKIERVLVVANMKDSELAQSINSNSPPSVFQLHGDESPERCLSIKSQFPSIRLWKAFRVRNQEELKKINLYEKNVEAVLLDAWNPFEIGGTGNRIPIELIQNIEFKLPWWLAGGISAEWIPEALSKVCPYGIDASSRLETSAGIKDLDKVKSLIKAVKNTSTRKYLS